MPDILIQPNADADDDLTNAIVMDDTTLPLTSQGAVALGLTLGTTYKARVLGVVETFSVAVPATAPAQMSAPTVTATGSDSISVDRAAAPADGGSAITSYDLRHSTDESTWTTVTGISDPQTVSGLTASTLYYVQTRAVNAVGAGTWSTSGSATTEAASAGTIAEQIVAAIGAKAKGLYKFDSFDQLLDLHTGGSPVTAADDPVGYVTDLSTSGNDVVSVGALMTAKTGYVETNSSLISPAAAMSGLTTAMEVFLVLDPNGATSWSLAGRSGSNVWWSGHAQDGSGDNAAGGFSGTSTNSVNDVDVGTQTAQAVYTAVTGTSGYRVHSVRGVDMVTNMTTPLIFSAANAARRGNIRVKYGVLTDALTPTERTAVNDILETLV